MATIETATGASNLAFTEPHAPAPDPEEKANAISAVGIRRLVGYLGILLPFLCLIWGVAVHIYPPSISACAYTAVHGPFTAILCGLGMVLYVYRGYDKWDKVATNIASFAAFGVGLFWTSVKEVTWITTDQQSLDHLRLVPDNMSGNIHNVCAGTLFFMFFFISAFLFTRRLPADNSGDAAGTKKNFPGPDFAGDKPDLKEFVDTAKATRFFLATPVALQKKDARERENATHRRCAWVILVSIIVSVATSGHKFPLFPIAEAVAIFAFAWSWLTKNHNTGNVFVAIGQDVQEAKQDMKKMA